MSQSARSNARLHAVQALYQHEMAADDARPPAQLLVAEYLAHRVGDVDEEVNLGLPDRDFFRDLVEGAIADQAALDAAISARLRQGWSLQRLESVNRAILRLGGYELAHRPDIPTNVIIDEYVEIAHAFFDGAVPGFINGLLDTLAREFRSAGSDRQATP